MPRNLLDTSVRCAKVLPSGLSHVALVSLGRAGRALAGLARRGCVLRRERKMRWSLKLRTAAAVRSFRDQRIFLSLRSTQPRRAKPAKARPARPSETRATWDNPDGRTFAHRTEVSRRFRGMR